SAITIPRRSTKWNFRAMPLRSDTVEAASRTLLLLEELNRHRVTSLDRLHKATGLPKSTVVRLMKSLCAMGYAANDRRQGRLRGRLAGEIAEQRLPRRSAGGGGGAALGDRLHAAVSLANRDCRARRKLRCRPLLDHPRQPGLAVSRHA